MADIFISYASADRDRAQAIGRALTAQGYSVWWDRSIPPGEIFEEVIQRSLDSAKCVIVLWSTTSVSSNWVKTEAAEAAARKILVPALIDEVRLPIEFKRIQSANLVNWNADASDTEFQSLLAAISRVVTRRADIAPSSTDKSSTFGNAPAASSARKRYLPYLLALGLALVGVGVFAMYAMRSPPEVSRAAPRQTADEPARELAQPGSKEAKSQNVVQAPAIAPGVALPPATRINLLAKENGGQLVVAPDPIWKRAISDYDDLQAWAGIGQGVFAFKNDGFATFDTFAVLIPRASEGNLREFELLAASDSPTGAFNSIGRFSTQNVVLMNSPFQEFKFTPVRAKFLKVRVLSDFRDRTEGAALHKFKLMGSLELY